MTSISSVTNYIYLAGLSLSFFANDAKYTVRLGHWGANMALPHNIPEDFFLPISLTLHPALRRCPRFFVYIVRAKVRNQGSAHLPLTSHGWLVFQDASSCLAVTNLRREMTAVSNNKGFAHQRYQKWTFCEQKVHFY